VLRDGRSGDVGESRGDLDDRKLARSDEAQDLAPMRLRDGTQGEVGAQDYSRNG
jgi:hypothetical protein